MPRPQTPYGIIPRPEFVITDEVITTIREQAERGLTLSQIASYLGIAPATLYEKKKKYPEVENAYQVGHGIAIGRIENAAVANATLIMTDKDGNIISYGDTGMQKFLLKAQAGYKETDAAVNVNFVIPPLFAQPEPAFKSLLQGELTNDEVTE